MRANYNRKDVVKVEELLKELEELEEKEFMLQMCDHWSSEDYRYHDELWSKIKEVKAKIKELENEEK